MRSGNDIFQILKILFRGFKNHKPHLMQHSLWNFPEQPIAGPTGTLQRTTATPVAFGQPVEAKDEKNSF